MTRSLLALGSNLGDRRANLEQACAAVSNIDGCHLLARSRWHPTVPIGGATQQGEFLNGAILIDCLLPPSALAHELQKIENRLGRERVVRWDARTLDIDVLLYGQERITTPQLSIPHPRMAFRKFVLEPAAGIAGPMLHPTSGWTIAGLLAHLRAAPRLVVVTADSSHLAEALVSHLAAKLGCPVWKDAEKCLNTTRSPCTPAAVEFPASTSGEPPFLAEVAPEKLQALSKSLLEKGDMERPALVIAVDSTEPTSTAASDDWLEVPSLGPLARITDNDSATIIQEAEAALRCIWPDLR